jgi:phosphoribosylformylglycinamidine cyclo-ligase
MLEARLDQAEMLRTFNCGIGMVAVVSPGDVKRVQKHLGREAKPIGAIVARKRGEPVRYKGTLTGGAW